MNTPLAGLISQTQGLQPWRRVFHATSGSLIVWVFTARWFPDEVVLVSLGILLFLALVLDLARLRSPTLNHLFFRSFKTLVSPREERRLASSTWYLVGAILVLVLFSRPAALGGILVMALADPAASIVGRKWGTRSIGKGTVTGMVVFAVVAFACLLPFVPWPHALVAALATGLVEVVPWGLDDNLTVPLAVAGVLQLMASF